MKKYLVLLVAFLILIFSCKNTINNKSTFAVKPAVEFNGFLMSSSLKHNFRNPCMAQPGFPGYGGPLCIPSSMADEYKTSYAILYANDDFEVWSSIGSTEDYLYSYDAVSWLKWDGSKIRSVYNDSQNCYCIFVKDNNIVKKAMEWYCYGYGSSIGISTVCRQGEQPLGIDIKSGVNKYGAYHVWPLVINGWRSVYSNSSQNNQGSSQDSGEQGNNQGNTEQNQEGNEGPNSGNNQGNEQGSSGQGNEQSSGSNNNEGQNGGQTSGEQPTQGGSSQPEEPSQPSWYDDILTLSSLPTPSLIAPGVYKYSNIKYDNYSGDGATSFNLYLPKNSNNITTDMPCVVYVHSGSWNNNDATEYEKYYETGAEKYADSYVRKYGLPVVSVDYRLLGKSDNKLTWNCDYIVEFLGYTGEKSGELDYNLFCDNGNRITDQVKDIETLFKFIKKNCSILHIDPSFAIMDGYSAGANLELLYALNDEYEKPIEIKALIDRVGPADMSSAEYVKFFSEMLTQKNYYVQTTIDYVFSTTDIDVTAQMKNSDKSGEVLLTTMINSATGNSYSLDTLKFYSSLGLDSSIVPQKIKDISPVYAAKNKKFSNQPYIVMAYGNDVDLNISASASISDGVVVNTNLQGDPLAPRICGEQLAIALNPYNKNKIKTETVDGKVRVAKNNTDNGNLDSEGNPGKFALYKGDIAMGEKIAFLGSAFGGHDICSKNDEQYSKHWSASELALLQWLVDYAVQTVCGIQQTNNTAF